jgi:LysM domain
VNLSGLSKQVGPLPLGVWLLVGGGGLFIAYRKSNTPAAVVDPLAGPVVPAGGVDPQVSSWDGAPVVLSPVVQIAPPRIEINNTLPAPAPITINVPAPIAAPAAPPRVASPVAAKPAPKPVAKAAPKPVVRTHTVRSGDTLSGIAGAKWPALYARNVSVIEAAARAHGRSNSGGGHWIYPGTVLVLV